jgi:phenylalanyl-tRNA synthetase beta chain
VVDGNVAAISIKNALIEGGGDLLESVELFDRYDQIGDGKVSLAFTLTFRSPDQTLTSEEVAKYRDQAVAVASKKYGAVLRG